MDIERSRYDYLFYRSEEYNDFVEFLTDVYLEIYEFDECWKQFEKWRDSQYNSPTDTTPPH